MAEKDIKQIITDKTWAQFDAQALFAGGKTKSKQSESNAQENPSAKGNKKQAGQKQGKSAKQLAKMMRSSIHGNATGNKQSTAKTDAFANKQVPHELEVAFAKGRELIRKLAAELDFTARVSGASHWDAKQLAKALTTYRYDRVMTAKYEHPRKSDIVMLLDISPSCSMQARMFMAIAAGAASQGVSIFVGFNGTASKVPLALPAKPFKSCDQAQGWVEQEIARERDLNDLSFCEFVKASAPKTCVIFGDFDGLERYAQVVNNPKLRGGTKFFWFANVPVSQPTHIPEGWTRKNYQPGVNTPADLVIALRKLR